LNFFLYINKKLIFFVGLGFIIIFVTLIFSKQINLSQIEIEISKEQLKNVDISEPKFTINNFSKKIYITAKEGNFLNKNEILLQDNVKFKSNDFIIETEKVIFNRNQQTAQSTSKSLFKSENTIIISNGFDIYEKGNKIIFYGNSSIILK
tara:strand:+ start:218 stop:667 length:450 start_codon:yes stop_codon:yes gene_type:complete